VFEEFDSAQQLVSIEELSTLSHIFSSWDHQVSKMSLPFSISLLDQLALLR
jgi:hypothetical protein